VFLPEGDWEVTEAEILRTRDETRRLAEILTAATTGRVTSPAGTAVTLDLAGRTAIAVSSVQKAPGGWASMPDFAEAAIAPVEGTAAGVAVIEGSVNWLGRLAGPVRLRIEGGRIMAIEGGEDARRLEAVFAGGDAAARSVAELGIGTVPRGEIRGENLDKRLLGTAHLGFGDNHSIGGEQRSTMHLDALMCGVTVALDGRPVVQGGRLVLDLTGC